MPKLCRAPIPIVKIRAPQITGIQKLRGCGPSALPGVGIIQYAVAGSGAQLRSLDPGSEGFDPGPQLDLQGPGAARLTQDLDIGLRDRVGIEGAVRALCRIGAPRAAHTAISDEMGD